jgi:hypothetical protein
VIDVSLIRRLLVWAGVAPPEEMEQRRAVVNDVLLDPNNTVEHEKVARMLDAAGIVDDVAQEADNEEEDEPVKVYDPKRRGYMRASKEEGISAELKQMSDEAAGTPFYDDVATTQAKSATSRELLAKLRRHNSGDKR